MQGWTAICLTVAASWTVMGMTGCDEEKRRPNGSQCDTATQCSSGFCSGTTCLDPQGDEDSDGLLNANEFSIGSNVHSADSDGDGILDPDEVTTDVQLVDTDGDGKPDVIESALRDADGDCITDQYDADDAVPSDDPSPMLPVVCRQVGLCAGPDAGLSVVCDDAGVAACVYDGVTGYAEPEVSCDGIDENCDGQVDEAFPAGCETPVRPGVLGASGGSVVQTDRYRAVLTVGPTPLGRAATTKYKAVIGRPSFGDSADPNAPAPSEAP